MMTINFCCAKIKINLKRKIYMDEKIYPKCISA